MAETSLPAQTGCKQVNRINIHTERTPTVVYAKGLVTNGFVLAVVPEDALIVLPTESLQRPGPRGVYPKLL